MPLTNEQRHQLSTRALSGLAALEACTDVIGDVLGAAQTINENALWFVTGLDLLIGPNVDLSGGELYNLLGIWATGGATGLEGAIGPLGFLSERMEKDPSMLSPPLDDSWKTQLADSAVDLAVQHVLERAWRNNTPRHYKNNFHQTRKP